MRKEKLLFIVPVPLLLCFVDAAAAQTKDVNLGPPGQGSWTTSQDVIATSRRKGLKVQPITFRGTNLRLRGTGRRVDSFAVCSI
jgi:hypothetical protein